MIGLRLMMKMLTIKTLMVTKKKVVVMKMMKMIDHTDNPNGNEESYDDKHNVQENVTLI